MGTNELSNELWRQRQLLETLLYKFHIERLLISAGFTRWIPQATSDVETVVNRLKTAGLSLAVEMVDVAREYSLSDDVTLRDVVAAAPEGAWREIFAAHLKALSDLTAEIRGTRDENSRRLRAGLRFTQETLNLMGEPSSTYAADGTVGSAIPAARLVDAAL